MDLCSSKWMLGAALLALPLFACAQADVRVTAVTSNQFVTQTRPAIVTFTATNEGPADALGVSLTNLFPFPGGNVHLTVNPPCNLSATGPTTTPTLTWTVGRLNTNSTANCVLVMRALPTSVNQAFSFALRATAQTIDPVPNNNAGGVSLSISPIDVVSDIAIQAALVPAFGLLPSDGTARIYLTVRNLGPDNAAQVRLASDFSPFEIPPPYFLFLVEEDPCDTYIDGEYPSFRASTGPLAGLAAGASITCVIGVERQVGAANGVLALRWKGGPGLFGSLDPDLSNNVTFVALNISPVPIPGLSFVGALLLSVLCLLFLPRRKANVC